jgi:hypothetical protein
VIIKTNVLRTQFPPKAKETEVVERFHPFSRRSNGWLEARLGTKQRKDSFRK